MNPANYNATYLSEHSEGLQQFPRSKPGYQGGVQFEPFLDPGMLGDAEGIESERRENLAGGDELEIGETAHLLQSTSDPVGLYLREMGTVRLLKREGEVARGRCGRPNQIVRSVIKLRII